MTGDDRSRLRDRPASRLLETGYAAQHVRRHQEGWRCAANLPPEPASQRSRLTVGLRPGDVAVRTAGYQSQHLGIDQRRVFNVSSGAGALVRSGVGLARCRGVGQSVWFRSGRRLGVLAPVAAEDAPQLGDANRAGDQRHH